MLQLVVKVSLQAGRVLAGIVELVSADSIVGESSAADSPVPVAVGVNDLPSGMVT